MQETERNIYSDAETDEYPAGQTTPGSKAGVSAGAVAEKEHLSPEEQVKMRFDRMNTREKLEYIWSYYKWIPITIVIAAALIAFGVSVLGGAELEQLGYGAVINIAATDEQLEMLENDALAVIGGDRETQEIEIEGQLAVDTGDASDLDTDESYRMACATKLGIGFYSGDIDFVIATPSTVAMYSENGVLSDLSLYVSIEALGDRAVFTDDGICVGVTLAAEEMNSEYGEVLDGSVFCLPGSSQNKDMSAEVLEMLLGGAAEQGGM